MSAYEQRIQEAMADVMTASTKVYTLFSADTALADAVHTLSVLLKISYYPLSQTPITYDPLWHTTISGKAIVAKKCKVIKRGIQARRDDGSYYVIDKAIVVNWYE